MHGVFKASYNKYLPFMERVTTREELSDIIAITWANWRLIQHSVRGGDMREGGQY